MHAQIRPIAVLLVAGGLLTVTPAARSARAPRKRALLVGVAHYGRSRTRDVHQKPWMDLSSDHDVAELKSVLNSSFGFRPEEIHTLIDEQATHAGIRRAFREFLLQDAQPGDTVVFQFSGHGQQVPDDNGDELDGLDETLVPFDYISQRAADGAKTNLRDDELGELLQDLRRSLQGADGKVDGSITLILDSCHSGTITRGRLVSRGRGWDVRLDGPRPRGSGGAPTESGAEAEGLFDSRVTQSAGYVALSACHSNESAQDGEVEPGHPMGVFTYYLCRALRSAALRGEMNYQDLFERVRAEVAGQYPLQTPEADGDVTRGLFSARFRPGRSYPVVQAVSGSRITLTVGRLQGATAGSEYALYAPSTVPEERTPIARGRVVAVEDTSSEATLLPAGSGTRGAPAVPGAQLIAARAVETAHHYDDQPLRVLLEVPGTPRTRLSSLPVTTSGVTARDYDLRVLRTGRGLIELQRKDGVVVGRFPNDAEAANRLRDSVLGQWRWRYLMGLGNDGPGAPRVTLRVIPVEVTMNGEVVTGVKRDVPARDARGAIPEVRDGGYVQVEIRNASSVPLYVTVLDLQGDGGVSPIFPHPKLPGIGERMIPAGKTYRPPFHYVFHLSRSLPGQPTSGGGTPAAASERDVFKVIATPTDADFSPVVFQPIITERGPGVLSSFHGPADPLAKLLFHAATGRRDAGLPPVSTKFWGSAEAPVDIGPR